MEEGKHVFLFSDFNVLSSDWSFVRTLQKQDKQNSLQLFLFVSVGVFFY